MHMYVTIRKSNTHDEVPLELVTDNWTECSVTSSDNYSGSEYFYQNETKQNCATIMKIIFIINYKA